MKRLLALLGAVAMIVVAVVIRGAIHGDDGGAGADGAAGLVCATELRAVCPGGATIEDAAATADRLIDGEGRVDAWLTFDPWPAMVDGARDRAGLDPLFDDVEPLASSPLVAVVPDRLVDCDWRCLGDEAAGGLRIGSRPLASGLGLLHLGAATAGFFGAPDFATNDLLPPVRTWIDGVAGSIVRSDAPVVRLLQGPFFEVALSYEAEAVPALGSASADRSAGLSLAYPAPVAYAVVVGVGDVDLFDGVADELRAAGWEAGSNPSALPSAGVLTALRGLL